MQGIATALRDSHGLNIYHRDVKLANLLVTDDGLGLVLCDFGAVKLYENTSTTKVTSSYYTPADVKGLLSVTAQKSNF